jgi:hypothetical protein
MEGEQPKRLGEAKANPDAVGEHTQLRWDEKNNRIYQAREFDAKGKPVRDIDFTSPVTSNGTPRHATPHQHMWMENPTGGTRKRSREPEPFLWKPLK